MNCHLSRMMLAFRRSDLTAEDAASLDAHLAGCPACAAAARREQAVDSKIASAMTAVSVPSGFRDRLLRSVEGAQQAAWRRRVAASAGWTAVAAAVLVAFAGYSWWTKPTLDSYTAANEFDRQFEYASADVPAWLADRGLPEQLPFDFDFRMPTFTGTAHLHGRDVPVLTLVNGPHVARVFIARESQFHIKPDKLIDAQTSRGKVTVARRDGYVYVVLYTSDTLDVFLKPPGQKA
ncbi:MAG: zf-HC2 domain-containing protein [Gemmataceae bacterium]